MNNLEQLKQQREENFKKIGQYALQKAYYENGIKNLLIAQEDLCAKIIRLERDNNG